MAISGIVEWANENSDLVGSIVDGIVNSETEQEQRDTIENQREIIAQQNEKMNKIMTYGAVAIVVIVVATKVMGG